MITEAISGHRCQQTDSLSPSSLHHIHPLCRTPNCLTTPQRLLCVLSPTSHLLCTNKDQGLRSSEAQAFSASSSPAIPAPAPKRRTKDVVVDKIQAAMTKKVAKAPRAPPSTTKSCASGSASHGRNHCMSDISHSRFRTAHPRGARVISMSATVRPCPCEKRLMASYQYPRDCWYGRSCHTLHCVPFFLILSSVQRYRPPTPPVQARCKS